MVEYQKNYFHQQIQMIVLSEYHLNIFSELKYELRDQWKANYNNIYEFKTPDDKYTCMFMNSENIKEYTIYSYNYTQGKK